MFSVVRVLINIVVCIVMCSEFEIWVFFRGCILVYLCCSDIRLGILCLVIWSFLWLKFVSDRLVILKLMLL